MPFTTGAKLGTYEIVGALGAGGMGEVYRARDSKLKREVAIKILPSAFSSDADRLARFKREAEVLASLNHPHIASIYDLVELAESRFLVLELVDGDTLADRIARGPIDLAESLKIARQISEALEAAHEKGIIHRDLKPANIKVDGAGEVKVLDFGLAKVQQPQAGGNLANSPTLVSATMPGVILGTAAYMAPEQIKGKETDRTADIWAFGCVLFEMLAGRSVFQGETTGEILAETLKTEPDWSRLPRETPEPIRRLLRRCLQKDPKARLHHIGDARIEIDEAASGRATSVEGARPSVGGRERLVWLSALGLAVVLAGVVSYRSFRSSPAPSELRLEVTTPPTADLVSMAISPDGLKLVFLAVSEGRPRLWVRPLDSVTMRPLAGTDFAQYPFWDPDSRRIGFFADGKLKRVDIQGGSPEDLADASNPRGAVWDSDGTILFASGNSPILAMAASGGDPKPVTQLGPGHQSHRFPRTLPGGRNFLFYVLGGPDVRGIYIGARDGSPARRLMAADTAATFVSPGRLLFLREGTLVAQDFDVDRLEVRGDPFLVAEGVARDPLSIQLAAISVSASGPIAYRSAAGSQRQLVWFDRSGKELANVAEADSLGPAGNPSISADARLAAFDRTSAGNIDIWLMDIQRGASNRLTTAPTIDAYPILSADGDRIVFGAFRKGTMDLYRKLSNGTGDEEVLLETPDTKAPTDWSRDGRYVLYRTIGTKTDYDVLALPLDQAGKPGEPIPIAHSAATERDGQFSPDGRWVAYQSNESGRTDIYVQQFPTPKNKIAISTNGGGQVRWSPKGNELFYIALDGRLMSVPVTFSSDGQTIRPGSAAPLFSNPVGGALQGASRQQYSVSPDGQRFLMHTLSESGVAPITVILNWRPKRS